MDFKRYLVKLTMDFICFCVFSSTFNPLEKTSELDCCTKLNWPGWAQIGPNTPMLRINILLGFFHFKPNYVQWFFLNAGLQCEFIRTFFAGLNFYLIPSKQSMRKSELAILFLCQTQMHM